MEKPFCTPVVPNFLAATLVAIEVSFNEPPNIGKKFHRVVITASGIPLISKSYPVSSDNCSLGANN